VSVTILEEGFVLLFEGLFVLELLGLAVNALLHLLFLVWGDPQLLLMQLVVTDKEYW